jgi:hypothetical protein
MRKLTCVKIWCTKLLSACFILIIFRWAGEVARNWVNERCGQGFRGKPEGNKTLRRPRCRWEDNIKTDLQEIRWGDKNWTDLAQDMDSWWAVVNVVMNLLVS